MDQQYEIYLAEHSDEIELHHGDDHGHHEEAPAPEEPEPEPEVDPHEGHDHGFLMNDGEDLFPEEIAMALRQQLQAEVNR